MNSTSIETRELQTGERMTRDEFIARWELQPELRWAELIGGTVYLKQFPVSEDHGGSYFPLTTWLGHYVSETPGCKGSSGSSWYMRDDMPQPENSICILPEYGGQSTLLKRNGLRYLRRRARN